MKYPALFLLGAILATGDPAYAAASPQADSPERRSNLEETEWQSAEVTSEQITPSKDWTDMQKLEWDVGTLAGAAQLCGLLAKGRKIQVFMKKSPYFRNWVSPSLQFRGLAIGIGSSDDDAVGDRSDNDSLLGESVEEQPPGS